MPPVIGTVPSGNEGPVGRSRTHLGSRRGRCHRRGMRWQSRSGRVAAAVATVALLVAGASGCSAHRAARSPATTSSAAPTSTPSRAVAAWPLTGLPSTTSVDRPALAVKIENSAEARPQTGLNAADLVWEEVVEGGITRYVAVYQSRLPTAVGPVRSIRPMDASIAGPLRGLFAFAGGLQPYLDAASAAGLQLLSPFAGTPGFYRVADRPAPHNLYANAQTLEAQADAAHRAAPPTPFSFSGPGQQPTAVAAGSPAAVLRLTLSAVSHPQWRWNGSVWLRSEGTTPAVTADAGQIAATNVVVLRVDVVNTAARDAAGNPVPDTILTGSGQALVATGGHAVTATWSKHGVTDPVALTGADGSPVTLAPGTTWIELVPNGTGAVAAG